jgi:trk system potassium uptake protein TrkH
VELKPLDALFTAVTSICVTGLSTVNIGATFSPFGQVVLLVLIQMGGLGVVTFTTLILLLFHQRVTLSERLLIQNAYNLETLSGLVRLTKKIVLVTLLLEGIGALGYTLVFVPAFGLKGIWYALFHAVSAFCNAGIDLLGGDSLCAYRDNVIINITTIFLIIVSGLGFPVYWEIIRVFQTRKTSGRRSMASRLNLQAKLVLTMTLLLIVIGAAVTLILEWNNPDTLGDLPVGNKLLCALFQSVTLRTAGFATINQASFREVTCIVYLVLMFIGGSPAGTAGGVKTVTVAMLMCSMWGNIAGRKEVEVFKHRIPDHYIRRCVAIVTFSFSMLVVLTVVLMGLQELDFMDALYEMTSAIATVGLSRGVTGLLGTGGKVVVILAMYLGRIGPITLALAFNSNQKIKKTSYAESKIIVG